jgi:hypothetical protein
MTKIAGTRIFAGGVYVDCISTVLTARYREG